MDDLSDHIADLIHDGRTIEAIKLIREQTGASLADAKAAVDRIAAQARAPMSDDDMDAEVQALLAKGRAIEAIKVVRERTGWDLKTSKQYVDAFLPAGTTASPAPRQAVLAIAIMAALLVMGVAMAVFFLAA